MKNLASELIKSGGSGKASHTKFWANVAYFTATVCFVRFEWSATEPHIESWWTYLGAVAGVASVSKFLSLRYNANYTGMSTNTQADSEGGAS